MSKDKLKELEKKIGVNFKNKDLLKVAMVHRSYINEHPSFALNHNERLEFLGDAVLELVVTEYLYQNYQNPEGELTNWRAALVNGGSLAEVAEEFGLYDYLYLSRGEAKDANPKARNYILANATEALIGAIYLDMGWQTAKEFITEHLLVKLPHILKNKLYLDAKSHFQELAQEKVGITPSYRVLSESGPDHAKDFVIGVYLDDELVAEGNGTSKQEAQMDAARRALEEKDW
ncbi:ribonuclease III [Candidatus Kuenenbacteria bacterium CG_4_9_14_3_um_filter_39_14]|uniref:Ribonuclease 3 n=7 Tax=Candidatus Kueneniibacteriota TaxID=1752740 RepID=A0A2M7IM46_9BACT|nr:ribonuclease III [Candidatus Kuenenbacteria bacterium]OIP55771.1 MAG: ribonuclease III [Candidatus Kuenenbacteria bacterium CG2_30_39_24]PIP29198.1 MAG: ribonuclease III [Candidatus Kuenenbacteria bacterium CG23_combo_of_CG06-09_8_20_14_all_39_39]PIP76077.1 MAG: ribonuclease III [Candidatus Kuenenbacteria bacterium CG22_combo_CG10-13_8_21_14_all_39_9]PIR80580.1 MAG: ribonuclease III [Candidatus Kuenenbacteria bacterium CG10_big_fil_rev_8_21_14_0_10_39_14]PIW95861.1 MAG: ribonuclease III [Ca